MKTLRCRIFAFVLAALPGAASAQVSYSLQHSIPAPPTVGLESQAGFGSSVAVDGGFTVVGAPYADTSVTDSGVVKVFASNTGTLLYVLASPAPATGDYFGGSVAISGTLVVIGADGETSGGTGVGKAFVFDLGSATPTAPVAVLNNPTPATGDYFGGRVSISGTRVVVGAARDDTGATNAGSAYVYDISSATPTVPVATLNNPGPLIEDAFGFSVAISGSLVVVGTVSDDTGAINAGSAYVYELAGATPAVPVTTLNNPDPDQIETFGRSVAVSGTRVVVGTPQDSQSGGLAYIYDLNSATPAVPTATLNNAGPSAGDRFGNAVAISGAHLVVGAILDNTGAADAGSACVYDLSSSTPAALVATLRDPNPVPADYFGSSVAISGTRVVIGAQGDGTSDGDAGSAYVYDLNSATPPVPVLALDNPGLPGSHLFGASVAISGTHVVVGVPYDDTGALGAGRAYVYDLNSPTPGVPLLALDNPNPSPYDRFGNAVAISGAFVVVGARGADRGAVDAGRAYVFDLTSATQMEPVALLNNPTPTTIEEFGYAVAISGTRVVIGALEDDTGANDTGSAYLYDLASLTPTVPVATLNNPSPADGDFFGISVAIFGSRVVVGARQDDTGADNAGTAYVYDFSSSTPALPVATIHNPRPAAGDNFALSVAIGGATVAIGAPFAESPQADKGFLYTFTSDADNDGLLDGWEIAHFGTTTGHSASDDADGDGRSELLELAFDTDPLAPDAAATPLPVNEGGFLTMTVTKRPGVINEVQSAGTLLPALAGSFSAATTTLLLDNLTTLKVRDNVLIGTAPARFIRTKVTAAP